MIGTLNALKRKLKMKQIISLLLILATPAYADQAIPVKTGDIVQPQFDRGTLLDKEKADKIKDQLIDRDALQKENESFQKSVDLYKSNQKLYQEENNLLLNRNIELTHTLNDTRSTSNWEKVFYVVLGAGLIYGASRITR